MAFSLAHLAEVMAMQVVLAVRWLNLALMERQLMVREVVACFPLDEWRHWGPLIELDITGKDCLP
jgi:hypothetical protein